MSAPSQPSARSKLPASQPERQRPHQHRFERLQQSWHTLGTREQNLIAVATAVVVLGLVWWVALAPALAVLSKAATQQSALDAQLQQMKALQAEAKMLQGQTKITGLAAAQALEASVKQRLGASAQLVVAGSQATLTLRGTSGDALAQWLGQARLAAGAVPATAQLRRSSVDAALWDGTLVLSLPAP